LFDEYIDFFLRMAEEGKRIEIIVNREILNRILKITGKNS
jgi:predicted transcriptional regulator